MNRIHYDATMVKKVRDHIVPLANELYERQAERIGVDKLKFYDPSLKFLTGNATPQGSSERIIENGKKMCAELSHDTDEFFKFIISITHLHKFAHSNFGNVHFKNEKMRGMIIYTFSHLADLNPSQSYLVKQILFHHSKTDVSNLSSGLSKAGSTQSTIKIYNIDPYIKECPESFVRFLTLLFVSSHESEGISFRIYVHI